MATYNDYRLRGLYATDGPDLRPRNQLMAMWCKCERRITEVGPLAHPKLSPNTRLLDLDPSTHDMDLIEWVTEMLNEANWYKHSRDHR